MKILFSRRSSRPSADSQKPLRILPLHAVKDQTSAAAAADKFCFSRSRAAARLALSRRPLRQAQERRCRARHERRVPRRSVGGGGERNRTDDLLLAKQALSQLSYTPEQTTFVRAAPALARESRRREASCRSPSRSRGAPFDKLRSAAGARDTIGCANRSVVGQGGFEPPTSRLSSARSNQLSY
jgi:predicted phage gp36 major capsid-like protein